MVSTALSAEIFYSDSIEERFLAYMKQHDDEMLKLLGQEDAVKLKIEKYNTDIRQHCFGRDKVYYKGKLLERLGPE